MKKLFLGFCVIIILSSFGYATVFNMPSEWNDVMYLWHFDGSFENEATLGGTLTWGVDSGVITNETNNPP